MAASARRRPTVPFQRDAFLSTGAGRAIVPHRRLATTTLPTDISIVIPAWGAYAAGPLEEALASLRAQEIPARILVVDNAGDPPLGAMPGVDLVRSSTRLSVGAARNLGLEQVRTPFVLFWDADDLMPPGTLAFLRERMEARPEVVAVTMSILDDAPRRRHRWPRPWIAPLARTPALFAAAHSVWSLFPAVGGVLLRTEAVRDCGGFAQSDSGEDWVLGVSLALRGRIELHERPGRIYRRPVGSMWERGQSQRQLLLNAASVRRRIRDDPAVPGWARSLLPILAVLQAAAVALLPLVRAARALRRAS